MQSCGPPGIEFETYGSESDAALQIPRLITFLSELVHD